MFGHIAFLTISHASRALCPRKFLLSDGQKKLVMFILVGEIDHQSVGSGTSGLRVLSGISLGNQKSTQKSHHHGRLVTIPNVLSQADAESELYENHFEFREE